MIGPLPVTRITASVTYVLTDLVDAVTGEETPMTSEVPVKKKAYLSGKVGAKGR